MSQQEIGKLFARSFLSFLACLPDPLPICMRRKSEEEEEEEERRKREDCCGAVRSCVAFFLLKDGPLFRSGQKRREKEYLKMSDSHVREKGGEICQKIHLPLCFTSKKP